MKRSGFKSKHQPRPAKQIDYIPRPRTCASNVRIHDARSRMDVPVQRPKADPIQHQGYMNLVRAMPCIRCKAPPKSQFCHSDEGKGIGIKSDCRLGWPGCAACHYAVGTQRIYPKEERRALEAEYARRTRAAILESGNWPSRLPLWKEST